MSQRPCRVASTAVGMMGFSSISTKNLRNERVY